MIKTDFHVHTHYCDGNDSPAVMAAAAYRKGFSALGFSGHSYVPFADYCMSLENTEKYKAEVSALQEQYRGKMDVFCGIEQDFYSDAPTDGYDYIIGSVHYILKDGTYLPVDISPEQTEKVVTESYSGSFDAFAEDYYRLASEVVTKTGADIIGHFDLVTKFSEILGYPVSRRYKDAALSAVGALIPFGKPFEINTGALRKYRSAPYPADFILKEIKQKGGRIILSGDCHSEAALGQYTDIARAAALRCGFRECMVFTRDGMKGIKLE